MYAHRFGGVNALFSPCRASFCFGFPTNAFRTNPYLFKRSLS